MTACAAVSHVLPFLSGFSHFFSRLAFSFKETTSRLPIFFLITYLRISLPFPAKALGENAFSPTTASTSPFTMNATDARATTKEAITPVSLKQIVISKPPVNHQSLALETKHLDIKRPRKPPVLHHPRPPQTNIFILVFSSS